MTEPNEQQVREAAMIATENDYIYRRKVIARLLVRIAELEGEVHRIKRTAEMSAGIMRDVRRTSGWEGSERTADAFDRIADRARATLAKGSPNAG